MLPYTIALQQTALHERKFTIAICQCLYTVCCSCRRECAAQPCCMQVLPMYHCSTTTHHKWRATALLTQEPWQ